jgi:hypothetical protein
VIRVFLTDELTAAVDVEGDGWLVNEGRLLVAKDDVGVAEFALGSWRYVQAMVSELV